ncbi:hypothetical protein CBL_11522 [Carabus blaptoides fortunei]
MGIKEQSPILFVHGRQIEGQRRPLLMQEVPRRSTGPCLDLVPSMYWGTSLSSKHTSGRSGKTTNPKENRERRKYSRQITEEDEGQLRVVGSEEDGRLFPLLPLRTNTGTLKGLKRIECAARRKDWYAERDEGSCRRIGSDRLCKECSESPHNQVGFVTVYVSTARSVERWWLGVL